MCVERRSFPYSCVRLGGISWGPDYSGFPLVCPHCLRTSQAQTHTHTHRLHCPAAPCPFSPHCRFPSSTASLKGDPWMLLGMPTGSPLSPSVTEVTGGKWTVWKEHPKHFSSLECSEGNLSKPGGRQAGSWGEKGITPSPCYILTSQCKGTLWLGTSFPLPTCLPASLPSGLLMFPSNHWSEWESFWWSF